MLMLAGIESSASSSSIPDKVLLVTENFSSRVIASKDLPTLTSCRMGVIKERLVLPVPQDLYLGSVDIVALVHGQLAKVYDQISTEGSSLVVEDLVTISIDKEVSITWSASPMADMLADSIVGLLTQLVSAPNLVRRAIAQQQAGDGKKRKMKV